MRIRLFAVSALLLFACATPESGGGPSPSPTLQPPGNTFTADDYEQALRWASLTLSAHQPSSGDIWALHHAADPRVTYEILIDRLLDPTLNPDLQPQLLRAFRDVFETGTQTETVNHLGVAYNVDYDDPARLATYLVLSHRPFGELLTADYCVDSTMTPGPCDTNAPVPAGILTMPAFLRAFDGDLAFRRYSVASQVAQCQFAVDSGNTLLVSSNVPGAAPADDPPDPPRMHVKYRHLIDNGTVDACFSCHAPLTRRVVFTKFAIDNAGTRASGFFDPDLTINDLDPPGENGGRCYGTPAGFTPATGPDVGGAFVYRCDQYASPAAAMASNAGCCYDDAFTDDNAWEVIQCNNPGEPACDWQVLGTAVSGPADLAYLWTDGPDPAPFYECQVRRFYALLFGEERGAVGLVAGQGVPPYNPGVQTLEHYRSAWEHADWDAHELLGLLLEGDDYLRFHAAP